MTVALHARELNNKFPTLEQFNKLDVWGLHISIDIYNCDPDIIRDEEMIHQYIIQLCHLIDMKRFGDSQVVYFGEDVNASGYSMVQLIETSLISGHFANITNTAYIDIFSSKYYDSEIVSHFSLSYYKGSDYLCNVALRK